MEAEPIKVERDLSTFYDRQAADRLARGLDGRRLEVRDAFIASLKPHAEVVEIGVGAGHDAAGFVAAGHAVVGIDLSAEHAAFTNSIGAFVALATARALPFRNAAADAVWTMSTLMHVPDVAITGALGELRRVLRPGGVAAIGVWGGEDGEDFIPGPYEPPRLFARRSDDRWRSMLGGVGRVEAFETWRDEGDDAFHYQFALVRRR